MSRCPPPPQPECPQSCPPPAPPPICKPKPIMRRLGHTLYKRQLVTALLLSSAAGFSYYFFVGRVRIEKYRQYHLKTDFDEWENEMAKKGLFDSVPKA